VAFLPPQVGPRAERAFYDEPQALKLGSIGG